MAYKQYLAELNELTSTLCLKPQTVGFAHKFFVPGWIGFIQECIVDNKMSKAAKQPIYNGLNFYECGNLIIELTQKACDARIKSEDFNGKDNENVDNLAILNSSLSAIDAWVNVFPEIAFWKNRYIDGGKFVTSPLYIIQGNVKLSLATILDIPKDDTRSESSPSFFQDLKERFYPAVAMICNIIVIGIVGAIISLFTQ